MPSTFVHGLLPPSCILALNKDLPPLNRKEWLRLLFISAVLGNLPDLDIIPASLLPNQWQEIHRNWGHNVFSICLWIFLGTKVIVKWASPALEGRKWILSSLLVFSHLFLDSMQDYDHFGILRGVPLFWPFSNTEYSLPFRVFRVLHLEHNLHFLVAHVTSFEFWHTAILYEINNSLILFGLWTATYFTITRTGKFLKQSFFARREKLQFRKTLEKSAFPSRPDEQQCIQERPSHRLQDDSLTRINTGS